MIFDQFMTIITDYYGLIMISSILLQVRLILYEVKLMRECMTYKLYESVKLKRIYYYFSIVCIIC